MTPNKTILEWTSKVQYKKSTPYISLVKILSQKSTLKKGNKVICKLVILENKLSVLIDVE
ncbi:MAG: hypothetical protein WC595_02055 [Candidatus Nanoarchaeia archaeon]